MTETPAWIIVRETETPLSYPIGQYYLREETAMTEAGKLTKHYASDDRPVEFKVLAITISITP